MATNYMELISDNYPTVICSSPDPFDYTQIVWLDGDPLPLQSDLDTLWLSTSITNAQNNVNCYRDNVVLNNGFYYQTNLFDCDTLAKANVTGAITSVLVGEALPSNFTWRSKMNTNIPMNAQQLTGLGVSMAAYVATMFSWSWAIKAYLATMTDADAINAFDPSTIWPNNNFDGSGPGGITTDQSLAALESALAPPSTTTSSSSSSTTSS